MSNDRPASSRAGLAASLAHLRRTTDATPLDAPVFGAPSPLAPARRRAAIGVPALEGLFVPAALHEIHAASEADVAASAGFTLGIAVRVAAGRPIVWIRQEFLDAEAGRPHPPGLAEIGGDPAAVTLVRTRDARSALQAGLDAARCRAVGAVLIELWGETRDLDLTASRRLALATRGSGTTVLLARVAAEPAPSAAETRWRVAARPSRPCLANAPGPPAFAVELLRRRAGIGGRAWCVEWNRDRACFEERGDRGDAALSRPVGPVSADRPVAAGAPTAFVRRTG